MRLLHTTRLEFEEFYEDQIPLYAILSHRWGSVNEEVSYSDFMSGAKRRTTGYAKILSFCRIAKEDGLDFCWVDTCCIDKTSSAELSWAINSMFRWYQRARICFAYLQDVTADSELESSDWFKRGWTLQELIAPSRLVFLDTDWLRLGTREQLRSEISRISRIDKDILEDQTALKNYAVAQIMSWAAGRRTSRSEDQAYCLLGLFDVNMPLLYGEGTGAFYRLQEAILAKGDDDSLFAWGSEAETHGQLMGQPSMFAESADAFRDCGDIIRRFPSKSVLFEKTGYGMMILIHRSYNPEIVSDLLQCVELRFHPEPGLTIPLSCGRHSNPHRPITGGKQVESGILALQLILDHGKWRRVGVVAVPLDSGHLGFISDQKPVYTNDYVRLYAHHDPTSQYGRYAATPSIKHSLFMSRKWPKYIRWIHLQDASKLDIASMSGLDAETGNDATVNDNKNLNIRDEVPMAEANKASTNQTEV